MAGRKFQLHKRGLSSRNWSACSYTQKEALQQYPKQIPTAYGVSPTKGNREIMHESIYSSHQTNHRKCRFFVRMRWVFLTLDRIDVLRLLRSHFASIKYYLHSVNERLFEQKMTMSKPCSRHGISLKYCNKLAQQGEIEEESMKANLEAYEYLCVFFDIGYSNPFICMIYKINGNFQDKN